jgi:hypothetical protein
MADKYIHNINGIEVPFTEEEITARKIEEAEATNGAKLKQIKQIRLQKLIETDYLALSDVVLSDAWKNKRQSWRDIPQNFTTESQYDLLLARDSDGNLTHTIWESA